MELGSWVLNVPVCKKSLPILDTHWLAVSSLECCGALLPRFILLHGSNGLWPCVGHLINPQHHGHMLLWALRFLTEVFIFMMIQDSPWTPLSYTLATLAECVTSSAPVLVCLLGAFSFSFFLGSVFACVCVVLPPVQFLPPSLRREKSGAQFFSCVLYGVSKASADVETQAKESILPTMVTKAWRVGAPKVSCALSPFPYLLVGVMTLISFLPCFGIFWLGESPT